MKELTGINITDDSRAKLYSKYLDVSVDMLTSIVLNIQLSFENEKFYFDQMEQKRRIKAQDYF